jgi:SAM-dependent methyltransferase
VEVSLNYHVMEDVLRYQDFVIKNGEFIGEFDEMYRKFDDPWHQSNEDHYASLSRRSVCYYLEKYDIDSIVEWGCGLGSTSRYIKENTQKEIDILGIDISATAIERAKTASSNISFKVDDISNISNYNDYECFFFSEITWYLLEGEKLDNIFEEIRINFSGKGKYLIHNLVFYKNDAQKYGREYFSTLDQFIDYCPFEILGKVEIDIAAGDTTETSAIFKI